jgi:hypothetical protein
MLMATNNTIAAETIRQKTQLQVTDFGSVTGLNSDFSTSFTSAGRTSSVTAPDKAIITHKNTPTVL